MKSIYPPKPILVIGATGNIGRELVAQLIETGVPVRAMVRAPDCACMPPQVEVLRGDLTLPDTIMQCLTNIESIFLVWTAPQSAAEAALQLIAKYARRLVFLSAPLKTPHPFFQQPNPGRTLALHLEQLIEASGLEWTILRPGMFALNARHFWGPQIRTGNLVRWPYLSAATAPIHERDIARVAVRILSEQHHGGKDYVLTGPQSLTQFDQIAIIGNVLERPLRIEEISPDEAQRTCLAEMPPALRTTLLGAWAAAVGLPAFVTSTVEGLTRIPARSFRNWVDDNVPAFRACSAEPYALPPDPGSLT